MKCSNCSHPISEGEKFCSKCGQKIIYKSESNQNTKYCSNCGKQIDEDSQFCQSCGCSVNGESKYNINNNNQSNNFLSGQYDKMIGIGYAMLVLQFMFGIVFGIIAVIIGFYLITRPNSANGTDPNDLINNPSKNTFIHGILLIILPIFICFILFFMGISFYHW